nr:hypothetical protein [Tanacetum cinerariifolium]
MGDEHLSTILKMETDKVIKSSVKSLVPILCESEVTLDIESKCDEPINDESSPIFTTFSNPLLDCNVDFTSSDDKLLFNGDVPMEYFKIYSNTLFDDEESIYTKIDPHYFNAESNLLESLLNRDTLIDSYPKFDYLLKVFSGELAHIDPIPSRIKEANFDLEEQIQLLSDDPLPLPENESFNFDHHDDPSFPRPPPKPLDIEVFFDFDPDTGVLTTKVVKAISEQYVLMPNIFPILDPNLDYTPSHDSLRSGNKIFDLEIFFEVQSKRLLSREEFSISFIRDPLYLMFDTLLPFSSRNEDKVFKPGILSYLLISHREKITSSFYKNPMMMYEGDIPVLDVLYLYFYPP